MGGNSKVYGAALFRLLPADFGEVQHPNGVAPAWPLGYQDMEPYYVRAEHLFWVHGQHGEDPFAGPSSQDYPYPPVRHEPRIQQLSDGLQQLGLHPFHLPMGVQLTQDAQGRATTDSPCIRCDRVDGFPCLLGAKADAEWAVIRPALAAHPNLTLLTRTTAERLMTDSSGRSVEWRSGHAPRRHPAHVHRRHRRAVRGRDPVRRPAAEVGQRPAPGWSGQLIRPWSAGTTCGTTTWP